MTLDFDNVEPIEKVNLPEAPVSDSSVPNTWQVLGKRLRREQIRQTDAGNFSSEEKVTSLKSGNDDCLHQTILSEPTLSQLCDFSSTSNEITKRQKLTANMEKLNVDQEGEEESLLINKRGNKADQKRSSKIPTATNGVDGQMPSQFILMRDLEVESKSRP